MAVVVSDPLRNSEQYVMFDVLRSVTYCWHELKLEDVRKYFLESNMFLKAFFSFLSFSIHSISGGVAPCCRFSPSCSQYASEAVERFG
jgi:hypothetical protein